MVSSGTSTGTRRSALISSMVNLGGLAFGPLVGGLLAQYVASPLERPYEIFLVLLLLSAVGIAVVPETVERLEERPAYRPQRVALPSSTKPLFFASAAGAFAAFAIFGLFTSLAPTFLAGTLHHTSRLLAAVVTFAVFIAGAGVGLVFRGEVLAALFLIAYAGLVIPVLAIGLGIALLPAQLALLFTALILILVNTAVPRMLAAQK